MGNDDDSALKKRQKGAEKEEQKSKLTLWCNVRIFIERKTIFITLIFLTAIRGPKRSNLSSSVAFFLSSTQQQFAIYVNELGQLIIVMVKK